MAGRQADSQSLQYLIVVVVVLNLLLPICRVTIVLTLWIECIDDNLFGSFDFGPTKWATLEEKVKEVIKNLREIYGYGGVGGCKRYLGVDMGLKVLIHYAAILNLASEYFTLQNLSQQTGLSR